MSEPGFPDVRDDRIYFRGAYPRIINVATPAAGAEWTQSVPGGIVWKVFSVLATLTSSAVVATRTPTFAYSDGNSRFSRIVAGGNQAASTVGLYDWGQGIGVTSSASGAAGFLAPLPDLPLYPAFLVSSVTVNLDAGDQWSGIVLYVLEVEQDIYDRWLALEGVP